MGEEGAFRVGDGEEFTEAGPGEGSGVGPGRPRRDDFQLMRNLGEGSVGTVTQVMHRKSRNVYALKAINKQKVLDNGLGNQLVAEVKTQMTVSHPNLLKCFEYFEEQGTVFLVLEFANGGDLYRFMKKYGPMREPDAAYVFAQVADGVQYLHDNGMIHRDLKPENVLLTGDLIVKVADFGWCAMTDQGRTTFCGTLCILAPEMVMGKDYDSRIDSWATGVLLFEMLAGVSPFDRGGGLMQTCRNIVGEGLAGAPIEKVPKAAHHLIGGLLAQEASDRLLLSAAKVHPWVEQRCAERRGMPGPGSPLPAARPGQAEASLASPAAAQPERSAAAAHSGSGTPRETAGMQIESPMAPEFTPPPRAPSPPRSATNAMTPVPTGGVDTTPARRDSAGAAPAVLLPEPRPRAASPPSLAPSPAHGSGAPFTTPTRADSPPSLGATPVHSSGALPGGTPPIRGSRGAPVGSSPALLQNSGSPFGTSGGSTAAVGSGTMPLMSPQEAGPPPQVGSPGGRGAGWDIPATSELLVETLPTRDNSRWRPGQDQQQPQMPLPSSAARNGPPLNPRGASALSATERTGALGRLMAVSEEGPSQAEPGSEAGLGRVPLSDAVLGRPPTASFGRSEAAAAGDLRRPSAPGSSERVEQMTFGYKPSVPAAAGRSDDMAFSSSGRRGDEGLAGRAADQRSAQTPPLSGPSGASFLMPAASRAPQTPSTPQREGYGAGTQTRAAGYDHAAPQLKLSEPPFVATMAQDTLSPIGGGHRSPEQELQSRRRTPGDFYDQLPKRGDGSLSSASVASGMSRSPKDEADAGTAAGGSTNNYYGAASPSQSTSSAVARLLRERNLQPSQLPPAAAASSPNLKGAAGQGAPAAASSPNLQGMTGPGMNMRAAPPGTMPAPGSDYGPSMWPQRGAAPVASEPPVWMPQTKERLCALDLDDESPVARRPAGERTNKYAMPTQAPERGMDNPKSRIEFAPGSGSKLRLDEQGRAQAPGSGVNLEALDERSVFIPKTRERLSPLDIYDQDEFDAIAAAARARVPNSAPSPGKDYPAAAGYAGGSSAVSPGTVSPMSSSFIKREAFESSSAAGGRPMAPAGDRARAGLSAGLDPPRSPNNLRPPSGEDFSVGQGYRMARDGGFGGDGTRSGPPAMGRGGDEGESSQNMPGWLSGAMRWAENTSHTAEDYLVRAGNQVQESAARVRSTVAPQASNAELEQKQRILANQLMELGFSSHQAQEAAKRCSTAEAGVDWILQSGIS